MQVVDDTGTNRYRLQLFKDGSLTIFTWNGTDWVFTRNYVNTPWTTVGNIHYKRVDGIVYISSIDAQVPSNNYTLLTLPEGYRPAYLTLATAFGGEGARVTANTNGALVAWGSSFATGVSKSYSFSMSYPAI